MSRAPGVDAGSVGLLIGYAARLEQQVYAPTRTRGLAHEAVLVTVAAGLGVLLRRLPQPAQILVVPATTWTVLGGRSLDREAEEVHRHLAARDLAAARLQIRHLVGRDPSALSADEITRACVEPGRTDSSAPIPLPPLEGRCTKVDVHGADDRLSHPPLPPLVLDRPSRESGAPG